MSILEILKRAKVFYEDYSKTSTGALGMCNAIDRVMSEEDKLLHNIYHNDESKWIPEFNKKFLGGTGSKKAWYWWPSYDSESRLEAFDKLINLYQK